MAVSQNQEALSSPHLPHREERGALCGDGAIDPITGGNCAPLCEVLVTELLTARPARQPDWQAESTALRALGAQLAGGSEKILSSLVALAVRLCGAGSAGVSLLETTADGERVFRWVAAAGECEPFENNALPAGFSPCGVTLQMGAPQLFSHPDRRFTYLRPAGLFLAEVLVVPLRSHGRSQGTIWIISHREGYGFDSEDVRVMASLADFTAAALAQAEMHTAAVEAARRERLLELERSARAEAEAANRAKDRFLAMLSHELRTPLNPIIGYTQLLRRGRLSLEAQATALEVIERNAKLQNQLIEDLLDVSRIEQGKFELRIQVVAPASIVAAAVETVRALARSAGVELHSRVDGELPCISADPTRLSQAVWNLLTNAIKFTPAGGQVEVRLEATGAGVQLQVRDSGIGIAPDFVPCLFERFSQGSEGPNRTHGGLGLGLFIVRHIAEAHGGTVRAASAGEGQGATFTLELPCQR